MQAHRQFKLLASLDNSQTTPPVQSAAASQSFFVPAKSPTALRVDMATEHLAIAFCRLVFLGLRFSMTHKGT